MGRNDAGNSSTPVINNAYAVVARDEEAVGAVAVELDAPNIHCVPFQYAHIPETHGMTWSDDFFDDDDEVIAVFDLDYERMVSYYSQFSWAVYIGSIFVPNCFWLGLCFGVPCYLNANVNWAVRSQHVAITRDGVRYVQEARRTMWGSPCTNAGKTTKTIPFDKITDCSIVEPAGTTCFCIDNVLHTVHIDTAGRTDNHQHELTITGLKNPQALKRLIWAMKRNNAISFTLPTAAASILERGDALSAAAGTATGDGSDDVASLLRDIRDELRQHNAVLQTLQAQQPEPSAPPATADIV